MNDKTPESSAERRPFMGGACRCGRMLSFVAAAWATVAASGCMVFDPCTSSWHNRPEGRVCYPSCEYYGYHATCWRKFPAGWGCRCCPGAEEETILTEGEPSPAAGAHQTHETRSDEPAVEKELPADDATEPASTPTEEHGTSRELDEADEFALDEVHDGQHSTLAAQDDGPARTSSTRRRGRR